MKSSLLDLLTKADFNEKHDHLILAGDMISKGPDSKGVVDLAMKVGASAVRGNHEDRVLKAADMMHKGGKDIEDVNEKDRKLVEELGEKRLRWLKERPVILKVGEIEEMGNVVVVHAGLAPGVELKKQDPGLVMNMRTIGKDGPSEEREGRAWMKAWNKYQEGLRRKERTTVVYGHDSKRGLRVERWSLGIDTGCLKGGELTGVLVEGGKKGKGYKIVQVGCKDGKE